MASKITYTFYLQCDAGLCGNIGDYLAHPLYKDDLKINFLREEGKIFFRKKLSSPIKFKNIPKDGVYDYDCLMALGLEDIVHLEIYSNCDDPDWTGSDPPIFQGKFTLRDCIINENDCVIEVNPIPNDYYDVIIREGDAKFNIMDLPDYVVNHNMHFFSYDYCKRLEEVIQFLLDTIFDIAGVPLITYKSTFFENHLTISTDNYVTGQDPNPLNDLMLAQKSDVSSEIQSYPLPFTNSTNGEISLNDLLSDLQSIYDIRYYIYYEKAGGVVTNIYFRIEHVSFFTNINGIIDLTVMANNYDGQTYAWHKNKYEYVSPPLREEFSYSEKGPIGKGHGLFRDYFLDYPTDWGRENKKMESHGVRVLMNDLSWMANYPTEPSPEGFMLFQTYMIGINRYVESNNMYLMWHYLIPLYWQDHRSFIYAVGGYIDIAISKWVVWTFDTKQRTKRQEKIEFAGCCEIWRYDFNIWELVHSELGWGEIESLDFCLCSGMCDIILLHSTPDIDKPVLSTTGLWTTPEATTTTTTTTTADPTTEGPTTTTTTTTTLPPTTTPI